MVNVCEMAAELRAILNCIIINMCMQNFVSKHVVIPNSSSASDAEET
jgi:hypothetical protein